MVIISWVVFGFLLLRTAIALLNWALDPRLPRKQWPEGKPRPLVSVAIPARNEEATIGKVLASLEAQAYRPVGLAVLNDHSTDQTAVVVAQHAQHGHLPITLLQGKDLPADWLGKSWACQQLAQQAQGEYLLFLDADVQVHDGLLEAAILEAEKHQLDLLSIFPDQETRTWGERVTVPVMYWLLLPLLPLPWVRQLPFPSMAAANGQFMLFRKKSYSSLNPHQIVRKVVVEDIAIAQLLKQQKMRVGVYLGNGLISCRMYQNYAEGINGFAKNMLAGFGNSPFALLIFLFLTTIGYFFTISLPYWALLVALMVLLATNAAISQLSNQPFLRLLFWHPMRVCSMLYIGLLSIYRNFSGKNTWKGRNL